MWLVILIVATMLSFNIADLKILHYFNNSSEDYKPHMMDNIFQLAYNDSNLFATDYENDSPVNETVTFSCGNR